MNDVSLIIPVYIVDNELKKMTDKCIESAYKTAPGVEIIVVDDGSPIGYKSKYGKTIRLKTNMGYSFTVNRGSEASGGDVLVIGNNDLLFKENWLDKLLTVLDEGFDVATCWVGDQKDSPEFKIDNAIKEGGLIGSIFAMTNDVYEDIGGFDTRFRGYFSDRDFQERAEQQGYRVGMNHGLVIDHVSKATYKFTDPDDDEYEEAKRIFEIKHGYLP
jgi:GT2 family glycosyltransferase